jgi:F-type H+-transporting ATPase subunit b
MNHTVLFGSIGGDLADMGKSTARTFSVDFPHFIAQVISFCIVAALLYFFAYKRVLAILEERRQRIADGLANADKIKAELQRTEASRLEVLNTANTQANKLIEEARAAANRVREEETQKAIAAAEQIITKAREAAAAERAKMFTDLKREVGRLVVNTTATVTGKILTPEDQKRLAEETAKQIA